MFRALRGLDKEAVMVIFPEENHNLSRNGSPHRRVERLRYLAGWFDWKLRGVDVGLFGP
jgi:dipeptidyl aminopeptidase/acylaminoacyl peptidase